MVHHYEPSEVDDKMALPTVKSEVLPHPDAPVPEPPKLSKQFAGELGPIPEMPPLDFPPYFAPPDASDTAYALLISFAIGAVFAGALAYSFSKKSCSTCPL